MDDSCEALEAALRDLIRRAVETGRREGEAAVLRRIGRCDAPQAGPGARPRTGRPVSAVDPAVGTRAGPSGQEPVVLAARSMIRTYGAQAADRAALRAMFMLRDGDAEGHDRWQRVAAAIRALLDRDGIPDASRRPAQSRRF